MDIDELRKEIDDVDTRIINLLNERAKVVRKIGEEKKKENKPVYDPGRENLIFQKIKKKNKGPLDYELMANIFKEIIANSRKFESDEELVVSHLGPTGTYSYFAAKQKFGTTAKYVSLRGIDAVFKDVDAGRANYGIVPVENSIGGGIRETLNMFVESDAKICDEIVYPVHHNLMTLNPDCEIEKIYSKPQVFGQCRDWLNRNFKSVELIDVTSSAEAAKISKNEPQSAAIAHAEMAEQCGLHIMFNNIEDTPNNFTRFFVLSHNFPKPSGNDKTIVMCYIRNKVGGLYKILEPFNNHGINLTNIEPLPTGKELWDYGFYIDFEGHIDDEPVKRTITDISNYCVEIKVLGSFPKYVED